MKRWPLFHPSSWNVIFRLRCAIEGARESYLLSGWTGQSALVCVQPTVEILSFSELVVVQWSWMAPHHMRGCCDFWRWAIWPHLAHCLAINAGRYLVFRSLHRWGGVEVWDKFNEGLLTVISWSLTIWQNLNY